jgi:uridine kinase
MVIGIAGGTGSGKTTVVKKIMNLFPKKDVVLLSQDNYYKDNGHLTEEEKKNTNFDHPDAIEFSLLANHVEDLKNQKAIEQPIYSYLTCSRSKETIHTDPKKAIIVEGILILTDKKLREKMDICVYVDAPADERLIRVIQRDIVERGRDVNEVLKRYLETVKPMHEQYIEPTKKFADIILPLGGFNSVAIKVLGDIIKNKIREEEDKEIKEGNS